MKQALHAVAAMYEKREGVGIKETLDVLKRLLLPTARKAGEVDGDWGFKTQDHLTKLTTSVNESGFEVETWEDYKLFSGCQQPAWPGIFRSRSCSGGKYGEVYH